MLRSPKTTKKMGDEEGKGEKAEQNPSERSEGEGARVPNPFPAEEEGSTLGAKLKKTPALGDRVSMEDLKSQATVAKRCLTISMKEFQEKVSIMRQDMPQKVEEMFSNVEESYSNLDGILKKMLFSPEASAEQIKDTEMYIKKMKEDFSKVQNLKEEYLYSYEKYCEFNSQEDEEQEQYQKKEEEELPKEAKMMARMMAEAMSVSMQTRNMDTTDAILKNLGVIYAQNYSVKSKISTKFSGKENFSMFENEWKEIEKDLRHMGKSDSFLLIELKKVLDGDAIKLVENLDITDQNYTYAIQHLKEMYGNPQKNVRFQIKQLVNLSTSQKKQDMKTVYSTLYAVNSSLESMRIDHKDMAFLLFYALIETALPRRAKEAWVKECLKQQNTNNPMGTDANKEDFFRILQDQVRKDELMQEDKKEQKDKAYESGTTSKTTGQALPAKNKEIKKKCHLCDNKQEHWTKFCPVAKTMKLEDLNDLLNRKKLCRNCFDTGHHAKDCKRKPCGKAEKCTRKHHILLHDFSYITYKAKQANVVHEKNERKTDEIVKTDKEKKEPEEPKRFGVCFKNKKRVILRTLLAWLVDDEGAKRKVRVFLDSGGELNLIRRKTVKNMSFYQQKPTKLNLVVAGDNELPGTKEREISLKLESLDGSYQTPVIQATTIENIAGKVVPVEIDVTQVQHLQNIPFTESFPREEAEVDIMIGEPIYTLLENNISVKDPTQEVGLNAVSFKLGWVLSGAYPSQLSQHSSNEKKTFMRVTRNEDTLEKNLEQFWKTEETGINQKESAQTIEEEEAMELMSKVTKYDSVGKCYHTKILFKPEKKMIIKDNNYVKASAVMKSVENRIKQDPEKKDLVNQAYREIVQKGFCEKIENSHDQSPENRYFLCAHPVFSTSKSTPCRLVYNASDKNKRNDNLSLNDCIYVGPSLQPDLLAMLLKFRLSPYVVTGDVSKMFLMIRLRDEEDKNYHSILWRNCEEGRPPDKLRLTRLTMGLTSSPFQAIWVTRDLAKRNEKEFPLAYKAIMNSLYVDDLVAPCETTELGKRTIEELKEVLAKGSFKIQKFMSNSEDILENVDETQKAPKKGEVLGVTWDSEKDQLKFDLIKVNRKGQEKILYPEKETKRTVLTQIAKIFDVLGLLQGFIIRAKILMQQLWLLKLDWDDPLPNEMRDVFLEWKRELIEIGSTISIPRYPFSNKKIAKQMLAVFGDSSFKAYGAVVYLIQVYENQEIESNIILSKAKVAPTSVSIPKQKRWIELKESNQAEYSALTIVRLELLAALLAAKLGAYVSNNLNINEIHLFTDSLVTLNRIKRRPKSFQQWEGNRLVAIHRATQGLKAHWHFVPTKLNPADLVSRGMTIEDLSPENIWWQGPEFLKQNIENWPKQPVQTADTIDNTLVTQVQIVKKVKNDTLEKLRDISSFQKIVRVICFLRKWLSYKKTKTKSLKQIKSRKIAEVAFETHEKRKAESILWRMVQTNAFNGIDDENLVKLNPMINEEHLICSSTRFRNSDLPNQVKFPIILPKNDSVVEKFVLYLHKGLLHCGNTQTMSMLNSRFHLIGGRKELRRILFLCKNNLCRKLKRYDPRMGPLPDERVHENPAFQNVALDYFGPLFCHHKCEYTTCPHPEIEKTWGCLFTCFSTRAIHLELARSLSTEDFLHCFQKFVAQRGKPRMVFSDNQKAFKAGDKQLKKLLTNLDVNKIKNANISEGIDWQFNTELMPWGNGICERLVQSVKKPLKTLLGNSKLTVEQLDLLLKEIEVMLNDRPLLTREQDDNIIPVTPSELLYGRKLIPLPDGRKFTEENNTFLKKLKIRRYLMSRFWKNWQNQYLTNLRLDTKWTQSQNKEVAIGDVVLRLEPNMTKNTWQLGKVVKLCPGSDGVTRTVEILTPERKILKRPVRRLAFLEANLPGM